VRGTWGGWRLHGIARTALTISVSNALARGIGLAASLCLAFLISVTDFGVFALLAATAAFVGSLAQLGFAPLITQRIAQSDEVATQRFVAARALLAAAALSLLGALILVVLFDPGFGALPHVLPLTRAQLLVVAAWSGFLALNPLASSVFAGHHDFAWVNGLGVLRAISVSVASLGLAWLFDSPLAACVGALAGEVVVAALAVGTLYRRGWIGRWAGNEAEPGGFLGASFVAGLASLSIQGAMWVCQVLLLNSPGGLAENGYFLLASRLALVVTFLPNAISSAALPHLSAISPQEGLRTQRRLTLATVLLSMLLSTPVIIGAPLATAWFGSGYEAAGYPVAVMAAAAIAVAANNMLSATAVAWRRVRLWVASDVVLALAIAVSGILLIPSHGAIGAAISYAIGYSLSAAILLPLVSKSRRGG